MGDSFPGSREIIRKALSLGEVPQDSLEICLLSITQNTLKQYSCGLRLWWEFCTKNNINVFSIKIPRVLQFLTDQFKKGASYGSLNSYRSALAQIAGPNLAQDFRIKRFFRGVFSLRQPLPRYENTWDPGIVVDYFRSLASNPITLEFLSEKLVTLLALATGQRIQTLSLIEISNILIHPDRIEIKIPHRIKTTSLKRTQPFLVLPMYHLDPTVCVATTLLQYLDETKDLRGPCDFLIITHKRPFRKATSHTLARWIKNVLRKSGIDINTFKAHSTRHAATSAAAKNGVSFDSIRLAAGWTQNSRSFANFYNRPIIDNKKFANTILSASVY
ncbi:uncharacterized protein LOC112904086 [Agrilus planipennis]|uniref:Uncharacterized protein LOC112904086 n=1 Tax=Agrilus planipennis TaxID=224129 RepID=A0A7F5R2A4_AGRPL|nr:uncharacterized protein LOC112904086 [Agrilus planipennis]